MFGPVFVMLPIKKDSILEKGDGKSYALMALGSSRFKIVLLLLTKVVAFHVQVSIVQIRIPCLKRPIQSILLWLTGLWWNGIPTILFVCLCELLEQVLIRRSGSGSRSRSKSRPRAWGFRAWRRTQSKTPNDRSSMRNGRHSDGGDQNGEQ